MAGKNKGVGRRWGRRPLAPGDEPAISVQPAAPSPTTTRSKLGLAGWRQKKQPASAPVQPAAEVPVQAEPTSHQIDTVPSAPIPTADELEAAAQKASQGDVDGVLSYRTRIDAYKLAELVTSDQKMRDYYRALLDADENGYPWCKPTREALQALEREIQSGNLDNADERLYDAWLALESEELQLVRQYNERVDELREQRTHDDIRPS